MAPADEIGPALADLIGRPLDDLAPALVIRSARRLTAAEVQDLVRQGAEDAELLDAGELVLEVTFELDRQPWVWRLGLDEDDLPDADEQLTLSEHMRSELTWRLVEWRDARDLQGQATPRLLRAS